MEPIFICHTGTDTYFSLADSGYIISSTDIDEELGGLHEDDSDVTEAAMQRGYQINDELATMIYELVMNYHEGKLS